MTSISTFSVALQRTLLSWEWAAWVGVRPSLSDGLLESLEDTLTESKLSPELPVGGERGVSLTGELAALESAPRNSLPRGKVAYRVVKQNGSQQPAA